MKAKLKTAISLYVFCGIRLPTVFKRIPLPLVLALVFTGNVHGQDPVLPATNLGLANVFDGVAGKPPALVYMSYIQVFHTRAYYDQCGNKSLIDLKINSVLFMNQVLYLSRIKLLDGNLGFTVLVPVVQISSTNSSGPAPTASPLVLGDPLIGVAVQWSNKKLLRKPFFHRLEFDVNVPVGNYDSNYNINPSGHLWNYEMYYAFTIMPSKKISVSCRFQFNYNSHFIGTEVKAGAFYNGNYSVDYAIFQNFRVEAVGYSLQQFIQDSYNGDSHYYQNQFGIQNTKERVFAYGPGVAYFTPGGVLLEAKVFFETAAENRFAGTRPTLHMVIPLIK